MFTSHDKSLSERIKEEYTLNDVRIIRTFLENQGTFHFPRLANGLFPAADISNQHGDVSKSGYHYVWVRDNIHIAHAHFLDGEMEIATQNLKTLAGYFLNHLHRFKQIINCEKDHNEPMNRPHVRFDGTNLSEIDQKWPHAENDALGYFLWLFSKLAKTGALVLDLEKMQLLEIFAAYFRAIRYWGDEDSGHWEETRKIGASSIGVVVGALKELKELCTLNVEVRTHLSMGAYGMDAECLDDLISEGIEALGKILPAECIQHESAKSRRYDAALLFLIYPMHVAHGEIAETILSDVINNLQGPYGIRRYPGDSYWCADYKCLLSPENRTVDFSDNIECRDMLLNKPGEEAQWCIFDPIVSAIFGERFRISGRHEDLEMQIRYFNRSLRQITGSDSIFGPNKCPEAYYLEQGCFVPNDHTPLLWTQANLKVAFKMLEDNLKLSEK